MIAVSEGFKTAIKQPERRIKGYVEVLYDLPNLETTASSYITSTYTNVSEINNGMRVTNHLASLDYLPLDGSYITVSNYLTNTGYVSDELYSNINTPEFTISWTTATTIKGLTLYFRTNIPTGLTIDYSDGSQDVITDNDKETLQIIFDEPKTINSVVVYIDSMEYNDRKVYIDEVDLGVTQVYQNQDLIEFTVDEEVNKLVEEVPTNETNVILNNMSDLFNPLNPAGIVPYLSENTLIKPYVGVQTENSGVQYVKMGEFYFDSYTNNSDATTTLVGKNIIKQVEKEVLKDNNEKNFFDTNLSEQDFRYLMENYNYNIDILSFPSAFAPFYIKKDNLMDLIKDICFLGSKLFYGDRNNCLTLKEIDATIQDTITKSELINDASYKNIERINTLVYNSPASYTTENVTSRTVFENEIVLSESPTYMLCKTSSPDFYNCTLSQTGATSASIITQGYYMCFVKITGTIGDTVKITLSSDKSTTESIYSAKKTNKTDGERENIITFESQLKRPISSIETLDYTPSYEMNFDYNGDPSLESGDYIEVETPYGFKPLFIQKHRIKFDGGLEGSIEGVE